MTAAAASLHLERQQVLNSVVIELAQAKHVPQVLAKHFDTSEPCGTSQALRAAHRTGRAAVIMRAAAAAGLSVHAEKDHLLHSLPLPCDCSQCAAHSKQTHPDDACVQLIALVRQILAQLCDQTLVALDLMPGRKHGVWAGETMNGTVK